MNNKNKLIIVILSIAIILIIIGIIITILLKNSNNNELSSDINYNEIDKVIKEKMFTETITRKELNDIVDFELSDEEFAIGKDSFVATNNYKDLKDYSIQQERYVKKVNKKILSNLDYNFNKKKNELKVNSWNYYKYIKDFNYLKAKILKEANIDFEMITDNPSEYYLNDYKAHVITLVVMDKYLDDYDSKEESIISINKDKHYNYLQIYLALIREPNDEIKVDNEKINNIYNKAVKDNLISTSNPLDLIIK